MTPDMLANAMAAEHELYQRCGVGRRLDLDHNRIEAAASSSEI